MQNFNYRGGSDGDESAALSIQTSPEEAMEILDRYLAADLEEKASIAGDDQIEMFIKYEYLRQVDKRWQDHLEELSSLSESVRLRSYAQKNPLVEYKNEGFEMFDTMIEDMRIAIARKVFRVRIRRAGVRRSGETVPAQASHTSMPSLINSKAAVQAGERREASPEKAQVVRNTPKAGRNDPCPCGSGKKYKYCCGK